MTLPQSTREETEHELRLARERLRRARESSAVLEVLEAYEACQKLLRTHSRATETA